MLFKLYRCYMVWGRSKYVLIGASFLVLADTRKRPYSFFVSFRTDWYISLGLPRYGRSSNCIASDHPSSFIRMVNIWNQRYHDRRYG